MCSHVLAQRILYEILGYFNTRFKDVKLNGSPHFDAPEVIPPETKGNDVPKIDVDIVAKEAVHHDSIVILDVFVGLTILIQDIICEAYHMKGDKAHAQLIEHLKSILVFVTERRVDSNINENEEVHPAQKEQLQTRAAVHLEHQKDVDDSPKEENEVKSSWPFTSEFYVFKEWTLPIYEFQSLMHVDAVFKVIEELNWSDDQANDQHDGGVGAISG